MRFGYFDESGIGKIEEEPFTVVAGFLLHVDEQYDPLRQFVFDMTDELVGKDRPMNFVFHAQQLFNGGGFFPRDKWSEAKRHEILKHLCSIPQAFNFNVFYSCIERAKHPHKNPHAKDALLLATRRCHVLTFLSCLHQVDHFMDEVLIGEKAFIVVEDHQRHRGMLREAASLLGNKRLEDTIVNDPNLYWRPHRHLIEEPLFQGKSGQSPLQVADVCAYIIAKHLRGDPRALPFVEKIVPQMVAGWRTNFFKVQHASDSV